MRVVALVATIVVATAGLTLSTPATGAGPTCDGRKATLVGTAGDDTLTGTDKADVIVALAGDDVVDGRGGADVVCGGDGADTLVGGPGDDTLRGGPDGYTSNAAGRTLTGDVLEGGPGDDLLVPGYDDRAAPSIERADTFSFASAGSGVTVDLSGTTTPGLGHASGQGEDTLVLTKRLAVVGSAHDDVITGSPNRDRIDAGAGDDTVLAGKGFDFVLPDGPDGQPGDDVVDAGPGPDVVSSLAGRDRILGGTGRDHLEAFSPLPTVVRAGKDDDYVGQYVTPGDGAVSAGDDGDDVIMFYGRLAAGQKPRARFTLDLPARRTTLEATTPGSGTITGFEGFRLADDIRWRFYGTDLPERVWAIGGGPLRAWTGGGGDRLTGTPYDDRLDGGDGRDTGFGQGGKDVCVRVELGRCP